MVYQQIVGIPMGTTEGLLNADVNPQNNQPTNPMGTNCAPLIADLFLYCCERDFMYHLHKFKRYDLIDKIPLVILRYTSIHHR